MSENPFDRALKLLGVDLHDGRSRVLRALFRAQPNLGAEITFEALYEELQLEEGGKEMAKPLVYRYLKSLEDDNLISAERSRVRNTYSVGLEVLNHGLEKLFERKIAKLEDELHEIQTLLAEIDAIDIKDVAGALVDLLIGKRIEPTPQSVNDHIGVFRLVDTEIHGKAESGDVIRINVDWINLDSDSEMKRHAITIDCALRGVEVRALSRSKWSKDDKIAELRDKNYRRIKEICNVSYRYIDRPYRGYQIVALNKEMIVLVVSEDPLSALLIPRGTGSPIIDDAIDSFDKEFSSATDMLDIPLEERDSD